MLNELLRLGDKLRDEYVITDAELSASDPAFQPESSKTEVVIAHLNCDGAVIKAVTGKVPEGLKNWVIRKNTFPRVNMSRSDTGGLDLSKLPGKLVDYRGIPGELIDFVQRCRCMRDPHGLIEAALSTASEEFRKQAAWVKWYSSRPADRKSAKAKVLLVPAESPNSISAMVDAALRAYKQSGSTGNAPALRLGGMPLNLLSVDANSPYLKRWGVNRFRNEGGVPFPALQVMMARGAELQATLEALTSGKHEMLRKCQNGNLMLLSYKKNAAPEDQFLGFVLQPIAGSARLLQCREMSMAEINSRHAAFTASATPPVPLAMPGKGQKLNGLSTGKPGDAVPTIYYQQVHYGLLTFVGVWQRKGQKAPEQKKSTTAKQALPVSEDAVLITPPAEVGRKAWQLGVGRVSRLLEMGRARIIETILGRAPAKKRKEEGVGGEPMDPWQRTLYQQNRALQMLCWFMDIAHMKPTKDNPSLILGAILAAADRMHLSYRKARGSKMPGELFGEGCLSQAQLNPDTALARLSMKLQSVVKEGRRWKEDPELKKHADRLSVVRHMGLINQLFEVLRQSLLVHSYAVAGGEHAAVLVLGYHADPWAWFVARPYSEGVSKEESSETESQLQTT